MAGAQKHDYEAIKKEYITENKSFSFLARKYDIAYTTLYKFAKDHKWDVARKEYWDKKDANMMNQGLASSEEISARIRGIAAMLVNKAYVAVEEIEPRKLIVSDSRLFKNVTGALKDIKEICDIRSDLDEKEQKARIESLEKKLQAIENDGSGVEIIMDDTISELGG